MLLCFRVGKARGRKLWSLPCSESCVALTLLVKTFHACEYLRNSDQKLTGREMKLNFKNFSNLPWDFYFKVLFILQARHYWLVYKTYDKVCEKKVSMKFRSVSRSSRLKFPSFNSMFHFSTSNFPIGTSKLEARVNCFEYKMLHKRKIHPISLKTHESSCFKACHYFLF